MARQYLYRFEIMARQGNEIIADDPADDDNRNYDLTYDNFNTSDPATGTSDNDIIPYGSNDSLDNENATIIINPSGFENFGPISGFKNNHDDQHHDDQNIDTNTSVAEDAATNEPEPSEVVPEDNTDNNENNRNNGGPEYFTLQQ